MNEQEPPRPTTLSGWKEIASHLGKSVRSVQRWEATLGLPVHRIHTSDGHIVYADRGEIDRWRSALDTPPAIEPSGPTAPSSPPRPPPAFGLTAWARVVIAASAAFLAFGAGAMWQDARRPPRMPAEFRLADRVLQALDADGRVLWTHAFGRAVSEVTSRGARMRFPWVDVNGDGRLEVLAFVRFAAPGRPAAISDGIFCFSSDGTLRWSVIPDQTFTFGDLRAGPPWVAQDFAMSDTPGPRRLWLALAHQTWWPSLVLEIDGGGRAGVRYVQAGRITSVVHWMTAAGGVLAVGGTNERSEASLALVADAGPPATHPGRLAGQHACTDCPAAAPGHVFAFGRPELSALFPRRHAAVLNLVVAGADLKVSLDHATSETRGMDAVAVLGPDKRLKTLSLADAYWRTHDRLAAERAIDHRAADCPERHQRRMVREWTAARQWQAHEIERDGAEQLVPLAASDESP